jgi:polyisoprenoid-binding protein YceI
LSVAGGPRSRPNAGAGWRFRVAAWAAFLPAPMLAADHYTLDGTHSIPVFEFTHLGATTQTGRFDKVRGSVVLDTVARSGSVNFEVETRSLNMGVGTERPDALGFRLLQATRFPKITFTSSALIFNDANEVIAANGQLTLLGVTKPVTVTVQHFKCMINPMNGKPMCSGDITATVMRSQFGMVRYIPDISDEIRIDIPVEAYKD